MRIDGRWFRDEDGRALMLRGVNLGGSSKVPARPDGATWRREGFFDHRNVSFVGRPVPLDEAGEHFARLRAWGLTLIRLVVTWEAVEHEGPDRYDREYLDYLAALIARAGEAGLRVFIDAHQDAWSRFSGGDGAPGWTFEAAGLDLRRFDATGAAFNHSVQGDPLPRMIWSTNASKLAAATMFTLFFAGDDFAPSARVDGESVQSFLQRRYIRAWVEVARAVRDLPNVIGFDAMNEPEEGFIGLGDLRRRRVTIEKGVIPTPFEAMRLGGGDALTLDVWDRGLGGPRVVGRQVVNPGRERAWLKGSPDVWQSAGVWEAGPGGETRLLRPAHFSRVNGRDVDFNRDYYVPFNNRFAGAIRAVMPGALLFVEQGMFSPAPAWGPGDASAIVYAPHWYDPVALALKTSMPWLNYDREAKRLVLGPRAIARSFADQLGRATVHGARAMGNPPVLIGETGIPFDLDGKRAYRTGDYGAQARTWDRTLRALDANLLSYTLWNYTPDNSHERGDQWNDEDFSIFSPDDRTHPARPDSGGRALEAIVRPYPLATAGEPLALSFDRRSRVFRFRFRHDPAILAPTLIFLPALQYPRDLRVGVSDGVWEFDREARILAWRHSPDRLEHTLEIRPARRVGLVGK